jgi:hypothetical protein
MVIVGDAGIVEPGAAVMIVDKNGNIVTTIADENGGFILIETDLPDDFDHTLGNIIEVTQESKGCREG